MWGFRHLSIGRKLGVSFGIIGLLVVGLGSFSTYLLQRLNTQIEYVTGNVEPGLISILRMDVTVSDFRQIQLRQAGFSTSEEKQQFLAALKQYKTQIAAIFQETSQWLTLPQEKALQQKLLAQWHQYEALQQQFQTMLDEGNTSDAKDLITEEGLPQYQQLKATLAVLEQTLNQKSVETSQAATSLFQHSIWQIAVLIALALFLVLLSALGVGAQIRKPLHSLLQQAKRIASGDLSNPMSLSHFNRDEIGTLAQAFADMQNNLQRLIVQVAQTVNHMSDQVETGKQVARTSASSIGTQEQELTSLAAAMNEMTTTVTEVARSTGHAAQEAQHAAAEAFDGGQVVTRTISAIQSVADDVAQTTQLITSLAEDSSKISMVLDVIRGIAEQTNLLALNAAIEAARAGEQGRGFAVVADEVRSLAQRTQQSTQEIHNIIGNLQNRSEEAVQAMQRSGHRVQTSVEEAHRAGDRIAVIAQAVQAIADMTNQIASATEQQNSVAEDLNRNIDTIHASVSVIAQGANQTAESSQSLAQLTAQLRHVTMQFQT
ncbi:methyl-accepting chemotaxis protein [Tolumonas lignilytica]|uniref:methyl-accepting chemotaxis protein n=1 Tax=Tolumonas lignilytica TaxID=1283284 RepID=UPI000464C0C6|nr:methyl-accepting chemotaxis protein [Tolumonas lignilytica]